MARFESSGLDELYKELSAYGQNVAPVADEMAAIGAEKIARSWINSAKDHGHVDTGEMVASIKAGKVVRSSGAVYCDVTATGTDSKGVRNATKAFILQYGKSSKAGTYWVDDAEEKAAEPVQTAVQERWNRYIATKS